MLSTSLTVLSLAVAFLTLSFNNSFSYAVSEPVASAEKMLNNNKNKNKKKKKKEAFFRIVSDVTEDATFVPAFGTSLSLNDFSSENSLFEGPPLPVLPGSQFLLNGNVFDQHEVIVDAEEVDEYDIPPPNPTRTYNQKCTAVKGILQIPVGMPSSSAVMAMDNYGYGGDGYGYGGPDWDTDWDSGFVAQIQENICEYNFCLDGHCLFLRSGGPFELNILDQTASAVPTVHAVIVGGTKRFENVVGSAEITQLVVPGPEGFLSVLQFDVTHGKR